MKFIAWIIIVLFILISILGMASFTTSFLPLLIAALSGVGAYLIFRKSLNDKRKAINRITISGIISFILLLAEFILFKVLDKQMQNIQTPIGGPEMVSLFSPADPFTYLAVILVFIGFPLIISYLEGKTKIDSLAYRRNLVLVAIFQIITFGIYSIYWFYLIKKSLKKDGIETMSLWWFLLPLVGAIILFSDFSTALGKKTNSGFHSWFWFFLLLGEFGIFINQAKINQLILA